MATTAEPKMSDNIAPCGKLGESLIRAPRRRRFAKRTGFPPLPERTGVVPRIPTPEVQGRAVRNFPNELPQPLVASRFRPELLLRFPDSPPGQVLRICCSCSRKALSASQSHVVRIPLFPCIPPGNVPGGFYAPLRGMSGRNLLNAYRRRARSTDSASSRAATISS
jgi:hypothetical protein